MLSALPPISVRSLRRPRRRACPAMRWKPPGSSSGSILLGQSTTSPSASGTDQPNSRTSSWTMAKVWTRQRRHHLRLQTNGKNSICKDASSADIRINLDPKAPASLFVNQEGNAKGDWSYLGRVSLNPKYSGDHEPARRRPRTHRQSDLDDPRHPARVRPRACPDARASARAVRRLVRLREDFRRCPAGPWNTQRDRSASFPIRRSRIWLLSATTISSRSCSTISPRKSSSRSPARRTRAAARRRSTTSRPRISKASRFSTDRPPAPPRHAQRGAMIPADASPRRCRRGPCGACQSRRRASDRSDARHQPGQRRRRAMPEPEGRV